MTDKYSNVFVEFFEKMSSWEDGIVSGRDISISQMHLLEIVGNNNSLRMKELSDKLGVTTGTLTVMVHRLVAKGYLLKEKDQEDKRSYFIKLTPSGKEEYDNHHHMHGHLIEEIVDELGGSESEAFFTYLERIQDLM